MKKQQITAVTLPFCCQSRRSGETLTNAGVLETLTYVCSWKVIDSKIKTFSAVATNSFVTSLARFVLQEFSDRTHGTINEVTAILCVQFIDIMLHHSGCCSSHILNCTSLSYCPQVNLFSNG